MDRVILDGMKLWVDGVEGAGERRKGREGEEGGRCVCFGGFVGGGGWGGRCIEKSCVVVF